MNNLSLNYINKIAKNNYNSLPERGTKNGTTGAFERNERESRGGSSQALHTEALLSSKFNYL